MLLCQSWRFGGVGSKIQGRCHFLEDASLADFICAFRLMTIPDFLCHLPKPLPIRDLRVFLRSRSSRSGTLGPHRKPTLVPRSSHLLLYTGRSQLSLQASLRVLHLRHGAHPVPLLHRPLLDPRPRAALAAVLPRPPIRRLERQG